MKEIEVKILDINRPDVEKTLQKLGAIKSFEGIMAATFFDFPDRKLQKKGDILRLRTEGDVSVLTFKKPVSGRKNAAKVMEETETRIGNPDHFRTILKNLGLSPFNENRKIRTQYDLGAVHVVIDEYQDDLSMIPVFLEIEAPDEFQLYEVVQKLGFTPEDCYNWSTYELVQHYKVQV
ncbi:MAG: class IV adenylate cyclase [Bacteroidia bacterium]|nr:class IV adenylate cyclase [Bacteroidia bacterium]